MKNVLMFSGQGSQYVGMGKELYETYPVVKNLFDQANQILGYSITDIMFNDEEKLNDTLYTQVAMFTLYAGVLEILKDKGIQVDTSLGLSLGEYGAMYHNEMFSFTEGLLLLQKRGEYMNQVSTRVDGLMSAILGLDKEYLIPLFDEVDGFVAIANYNTYGQLVISGEEEAVLKVNELALQKGAKRAIPLNTSGPFHTVLMKEASDLLGSYIEDKDFNDPRYNLLVNTTGTYFTCNIKEEMTSQITSSVMFYQMIEQCLADGADTFIEIGPKKTLLGLVKKVNRKVTMLHIEDEASLQKTLLKLEE